MWSPLLEVLEGSMCSSRMDNLSKNAPCPKQAKTSASTTELYDSKMPNYDIKGGKNRFLLAIEDDAPIWAKKPQYTTQVMICQGSYWFVRDHTASWI